MSGIAKVWMWDSQGYLLRVNGTFARELNTLHVLAESVACGGAMLFSHQKTQHGPIIHYGNAIAISHRQLDKAYRRLSDMGSVLFG